MNEGNEGTEPAMPKEWRDALEDNDFDRWWLTLDVEQKRVVYRAGFDALYPEPASGTMITILGQRCPHCHEVISGNP